MANSNKLSIYLIKREYEEIDEQIVSEDAVKLGTIDGVGNVYYKPSVSSKPSWITSFFKDKLELEDIFSANARIMLVCRIAVLEKGNEIVRTFALTWGYGKNLLGENVIEEDFGLKVVLNTIQVDGLRKINKVNIGGNHKTSNEQLPLKSRITDFGFDLDRDLLGTITGQSSDVSYVKGMITGGDLLSVTTDVDISNITEFLRKTYERYTATFYKNNFEWIDHIKKVKDGKLKEQLDSEVVNLIQNNSPTIWMAVPEVIEWEKVLGFKYNGRTPHDDIDIGLVIESFKEGLSNVEQLKRKMIRAISKLDEERDHASWSAYKCLCGEVELEGKTYCISNGQWFCIDSDFVNKINTDYEQTTISDITFMDFDDSYSEEEQYNMAFASSDSEKLLCMDQKNIVHGGGRSRIELCDVLTKDNTYIHIKNYHGSSALSHLFNQGLVSAQLVMGDSEFREKANKKIIESGGTQDFIIHDRNKPNVVFAIISKSDKQLPEIPFFSKVTLRYVKYQLELLGCGIAMKGIKDNRTRGK